MLIHTYTQKKEPHEEGTEWYVAGFKAFNENRKEITKWCYATFGPPGLNHNTRQIRWKDSINWGEAIFSRKEDLEWFVLRWS